MQHLLLGRVLESLTDLLQVALSLVGLASGPEFAVAGGIAGDLFDLTFRRLRSVLRPG